MQAVARAELNGGNFIRSNEQLKILWNSMMRKAGFATTMEVRNIFHAYSKDAILVVPARKLIHNYSPDGNANENVVSQPFFISKQNRSISVVTYYHYYILCRGPGVTRPGRSIDRRAVKKIANKRKRSYLHKAEKLDQKFAPGDTTKPLTTAIQSSFATGNAIPLVSGAVGEVCDKGHGLVELLAKHHAATKTDDSYITPKSISSVKGSLVYIISYSSCISTEHWAAWQ